MARKNLLASVTGQETTNAGHEARSEYASRGASRSMMLSIEEMAENAKKMIAGEAVVSLDPNLVDGSFVSDRIEDDEEEFALLKRGIEKEGQLQPILVRPHPEVDGRFMIVFGHRRTRAAKELGIPVRAVVKNLEAIAHIVAQGQENSRRANLSFMEKALFAAKLLSMGQSKETIKSALSIDDTLLSRMLSVVESVPSAVIDAIGAAKSVGRDRWEELKKLLAHPKNAEFAGELVGTNDFQALEGTERFNHLLTELKRVRKVARKSAHDRGSGAWAPDDQMVAASYRNTGKTFSLSLTSKDASEFGQFISSNLETLYRDFKETKVRNQGD
ncbi:plasmid partitioning protein RepB [Xanthobacter autotrophicus DSM 597]|uniref:plasmid partitioning protein RepB n=1 Tax=Xanthobacter wiegelii TaxID=3119913 RepID=UPI00372B6DD9